MVNLVKLLLIVGGVALCACQSPAAETAPEPALIENPTLETMSLVKTQLAEAMGKARIELGASDLETSNTIPVLPPRLGPYDTRSPAIPTLFDVYLTDQTCVAIKRGTDVQVALPGVSCRPMAGLSQ